ncbi:replication protein [Extibacter muris]|uniref:Replication protein n=2 Tax=Extibacter muris TaxID=1796622 RepID=A0A4R4FEM4_9FIRM|nr:replication protein [Extibacter muris]
MSSGTRAEPITEYPYKAVVEYLNQKTGKSFRDKSKDTQRHIRARANEGYVFEDFVKVIDNKCAEWTGTDMEQYLRPSTLFGAKFEGYLNQKRKATDRISEVDNW